MSNGKKVKMEQQLCSSNHRCSCSISIADQVTFGSVVLDENGYWEKPCIVCARRYKSKHPDEDVWPMEE